MKFCFDNKVERLSEVNIYRNNKWSVLNNMNYETTLSSTVMYIRVCGLKEGERYELDITIIADERKRHISVEAFKVGMYITLLFISIKIYLTSRFQTKKQGIYI